LKPTPFSLFHYEKNSFSHSTKILLIYSLFVFSGAIQASGRVAVGIQHSLAIDDFGTLWAWGANTQGQ
jgi:alpha-tubulin suppressor-like RCC1 family protein